LHLGTVLHGNFPDFFPVIRIQNLHGLHKITLARPPPRRQSPAQNPSSLPPLSVR
jgi:hypothetical protein